MSCTRQTGDCKVLSRCVTSPCIIDRPSAYAPGAFFDEEAGHGGAEACRRAEALALSMSPRLNSQNPGLFCQLLFDDRCQALILRSVGRPDYLTVLLCCSLIKDTSCTSRDEHPKVLGKKTGRNQLSCLSDN